MRCDAAQKPRHLVELLPTAAELRHPGPRPAALHKRSPFNSPSAIGRFRGLRPRMTSSAGDLREPFLDRTHAGRGILASMSRLIGGGNGPDRLGVWPDIASPSRHFADGRQHRERYGARDPAPVADSERLPRVVERAFCSGARMDCYVFAVQLRGSTPGDAVVGLDDGG